MITILDITRTKAVVVGLKMMQKVVAGLNVLGLGLELGPLAVAVAAAEPVASATSSAASRYFSHLAGVGSSKANEYELDAITRGSSGISKVPISINYSPFPVCTPGQQPEPGHSSCSDSSAVTLPTGLTTQTAVGRSGSQSRGAVNFVAAEPPSERVTMKSHSVVAAVAVVGRGLAGLVGPVQRARRVLVPELESELGASAETRAVVAAEDSSAHSHVPAIDRPEIITKGRRRRMHPTLVNLGHSAQGTITKKHVPGPSVGAEGSRFAAVRGGSPSPDSGASRVGPGHRYVLQAVFAARLCSAFAEGLVDPFFEPMERL